MRILATARTASRGAPLSSARVSKTLNVDRAYPPSDDFQDGAQFDHLQAFIEQSDLTTSSRDATRL